MRNLSSPSDEELFVRYRDSGEERAFEALYDRYGAAIYRFLRRLARNSAAAEDLTQQVFLRVHEARASFDVRRSFRAWVFTIAHRLTLNWLGAHAQAIEHGELADHPDAAPSPETRAMASLELSRVERALEGLPGEDVGVLLLRKFEGLAFSEIAAALGCSDDAAKMRAHRALKRLAERLGTEAKS